MARINLLTMATGSILDSKTGKSLMMMATMPIRTAIKLIMDKIISTMEPISTDTPVHRPNKRMSIMKITGVKTTDMAATITVMAISTIRGAMIGAVGTTSRDLLTIATTRTILIRTTTVMVAMALSTVEKVVATIINYKTRMIIASNISNKTTSITSLVIE